MRWIAHTFGGLSFAVGIITRRPSVVVSSSITTSLASAAIVGLMRDVDLEPCHRYGVDVPAQQIREAGLYCEGIDFDQWRRIAPAFVKDPQTIALDVDSRQKPQLKTTKFSVALEPFRQRRHHLLPEGI
jgi:hypothetical protein